MTATDTVPAGGRTGPVTLPFTGEEYLESLRDGREVYLCWQIDEPEVGHWHAAETGYPGRLPLDPWL